MEHISIDNEKCTGCSACAQVCPKKCIDMTVNKEGFLYPIIDDNLCIKCGACKTVCSIEQNSDRNNSESEAYVCFSLNDNIKLKSSSGGIFFEIAANFIKSGGYVCGAEYDENFDVHHTIVSSTEQIPKLMKSKYIQSNLNSSYSKIKKLLIDDKKVLFVGTPCHVKGLKLFLKKEYCNLICGEIVCHGVPSYKVFKKYTDYISKDTKLTNVDFRDKSTGWKNYSVKLSYDNGYEYNQTHDKCLYMTGFIYNLFLRQSCYLCNCKLPNSYADFTLGDLWGAEKLINKSINDDKGVSLYISNTEKGNSILNSLSENAYINKLDSNEYLKYNPSIVEPSKINPNRKKFFDNIDKFNFGVLWDYVHSKSSLKKIKIKLRNIIK